MPEADAQGTVGIPEISVVIPCRNEEANAPLIAQAVIEQLETICQAFEIIFIDNDSSDNTVEVVRSLCHREPRVRLIVNSRNFGQMRSPVHAIFVAKGKAVIGMSADFQDTPELLPRFVSMWRAGAPIVLGVRESEKAGALLRFFRELSYRLQHRFGDHKAIPNATGFGLYDRKVVDAIREMNEPEPFFRALLVETGFEIATVPYQRPDRAGGRSNNNFFTLLDFALNGLAGSSKNLLRAPLYVAFIMALLTISCLGGALYAAIFGRSVQLWLLAAALESQFCLLFGFLGLIGVQIKLISERTRNQSLVVEKERVNFPPEY